jgi:hypothetical protein
MIILFTLSLAIAQHMPDVQNETLPSLNSKENKIINGDETTKDIFPMTGGLLIKGTISGFGKMETFLCSSTLIAPDVVLLAAHCLDTDAISYEMGFDDLEFFWTRKADLTEWDGNTQNPTLPDDAIEASNWVVHPSFSMQSFGVGLTENSDIALLFLNEPVLDINPAYLPTTEEGQNLSVNDLIYVVGWGQQSATGWNQPAPEGSYGIKHVGESFISEINTYEIKIGEEESDVRKCHGDSGGPSFWEAEYGLRLVGVTSHAYDTSDCFQTGGVDTRVDHYLNWIDDEMTTACSDRSRVWCDEKGIPPFGYFHEEAQKIGSCSTVPRDSFWLLPLLGLIGLRRRSRLH